MVSRALSLATVTVLIGCLAAGAGGAQAQNLEAGKSPSQIFAGTCTACHKSPRGLLKTVAASSLPGFLRQHYTTSSNMASVLASYLVSNGAGDQAKQGKDAKQEARPAGAPDQLDRFGRRTHPASPAQEAAKPDADGLTPQGEGGHTGRGKRLARPGEAPDAMAPEQTATDSKSGNQQKLSKRGKPGEEIPKTDAAKPEAAAKSEASKEDASKSESVKETAKTDAGKAEEEKSEGVKPAPDNSKSETAKVDAPKETGSETSLRPDPVPPVTPAPATPPASSAASGTPEPVASPSAEAPAAPSPSPPAVTASVPPPPPVAPAGPPAPPISQ